MRSLDSGGCLTVYAFPVCLLLPIEDGVFILWQHLLLPRHLAVPPVDGLCAHRPVPLQGGADGVDDLVHEP